MRHLSNIVLVLLVLATSPIGAQESTVDQLNERLSSIATLKGNYTQRTIDSNGRVVEESGGTIVLKRPNMFSISTTWPFNQVLMSDGETFWTYDAELEQVIIRDFSESFDEMPVLLLTGDPSKIEEAFTVSSYQDELGTSFVLEPKDTGSIFETLTIAFTDVLSSISIFDSLGQKSRIEFGKLEQNPAIEGFFFDEKILERSDVIDERVNEPL